MTSLTPTISFWQQILATDAHYSSMRFQDDHQFKTLYLRRRSQLLRDVVQKSAGITQAAAFRAKDYVRLRLELFSKNYGVMLDTSSKSSRSIRGSNRTTPDAIDTLSFDSLNTSTPTSVPRSKSMPIRPIPTSVLDPDPYAFNGVHHLFDHHTPHAVSCVRFANDDPTLLAMAATDGTLSVCRTLPEPKLLLCIPGHTASVSCIVWCASNDLIASCGMDGAVCLWNVPDGRCIRRCVDTAPLLCGAFQPLNNNMLVIGNGKGMVQVMNISTGIYVKGGCSQIAGRPLSLSFSPSGKLMWIGDDQGHILSFLYDMGTGRLTKGRRIVISDGSPITSVAVRSYLHPSSCLVLLNCAGALWLYIGTADDGALKLRRKFPLKIGGCGKEIYLMKSSFAPVLSLRDEDRVVIVAGCEDGAVALLDMKHCPLNTLQGHAAPVLDVTFASDSSLLASGDSRGVVLVWRRPQRA